MKKLFFRLLDLGADALAVLGWAALVIIAIWFAFGPLGSEDLARQSHEYFYTVGPSNGSPQTLDQQWWGALSRPKVGPFAPDYLFRYSDYWETGRERKATFYYVTGDAK